MSFVEVLLVAAVLSLLLVTIVAQKKFPPLPPENDPTPPPTTSDLSCFTKLEFPTNVPISGTCHSVEDTFTGYGAYKDVKNPTSGTESLVSITIDANTTDIGISAFKGNENVETITFNPVGADAFHDIMTIKSSAFRGSTANVQNLVLPLQMRGIGTSAFGKLPQDGNNEGEVLCNLNSVRFNSWNIIFTGDPFVGCTNLNSNGGIYFDMNTVETISGAVPATNLECLSPYSNSVVGQDPKFAVEGNPNTPYSCSDCASCRCKPGTGYAPLKTKQQEKSNQATAVKHHILDPNALKGPAIYTCMTCRAGTYSYVNTSVAGEYAQVLQEAKSNPNEPNAYEKLYEYLREEPGIRATFFRSRSCKQCSPGSWSGEEASSCTACDKGKSLNGAGTSADDCEGCQRGYYADTEGSSSCTRCSAGYQCNTAELDSPTPCAPGEYSKEIFDESNQYAGYDCTACPVGKFASGLGNSQCQQCPPGGDCSGTGTVKPFACNPGEGPTEVEREGINIAECNTCNAATYSQYGKECLKCNVGSMCPGKGMYSTTLCPAGRYQDVEGQTLCKECTAGKYSRSAGSSECDECPPGSICPGDGVANPTECKIGKYSERKGRTSCSSCQPGKWQNVTGSAVCEDCAAGSQNNRENMTSIDACQECTPGNYSSQAGQALCTRCPDGYYQALPGQIECTPCQDGFTNNKGFTDCVSETKEGALSMSVAEIMIDEGGALWIAFVVTAGFMGTAAFMTYFREKDPEHLANFSRFEALYNSFFAGFSAGAELLLAISLLCIANEAGGVYALASVMFFARLIHTIGAVIILTALFGPRDRAASLEWLLSGASTLVDDLELTFSKENVYVVESIALLCLFDVTMFQFIPWKKSDFFRMSEGFPNMSVLRMCLFIKSVQSVITVSCEIVYLYMYENSDKEYTQALLIMNILVGVATVVIEVMMLCLRGNLLEQTEKDTALHTAQAALDGMELQAVYKGQNVVGGQAGALALTDANGYTSNPLHSSNATTTAGIVAGAGMVGAGAGVMATTDAEGKDGGAAADADVVTLQQLLVDKDEELRKSNKQLRKREKELSKLKRSSSRGDDSGGVRDSMVSVQTYNTAATAAYDNGGL